MEELAARIQKIEERNARVDANKRWEISGLRRISIALLTYIVMCLFLYEIGEEGIFIKALVTVLGFILSTLSLRLIRKAFISSSK